MSSTPSMRDTLPLPNGHKRNHAREPDAGGGDRENHDLRLLGTRDGRSLPLVGVFLPKLVTPNLR